MAGPPAFCDAYVTRASKARALRLEGPWTAFFAAARLGSRLALAATLVFAMLFGLRPEPSALEVTSVTADENDHATRQHEWPADGHELIAEAEETRDEVEERAEAPVGPLCAGVPALVSVRTVVVGATSWVARPRLGGTPGLGRGPPARA